MRRDTFDSKFRYIVCCIWSVGLLLGCRLAISGKYYSSILVCPQFFTGSSPLGFFAVNALPFILTTLVMHFADPLFVIPVVLFKSVLHGFAYSLISCVFGDAAWLVYILTSFSGILSTIIWLWYLLRNPWERRGMLQVEFTVVLCIFVLLSIFDFYVIAPLVICVFS